MAYLLLAVAIVSEVFATISLKYSEGFSKPLPTVFVVIGYVAAFSALAYVLKLGLPIGVAYAIWAGAGVALVAIVGALFLGETITAVQIGGILMIVGGVVALELGGAH
ncbi:multidrug efflux SMR transporter [Saccharopolyspora cebuensis]|uniref:Multidrug efflux SMR transporter n=1 Tax=Saccharopolyspora cebuensis TaxID=418759 RepID=A0ABV4CRC4_9PSEU